MEETINSMNVADNELSLYKDKKNIDFSKEEELA